RSVAIRTDSSIDDCQRGSHPGNAVLVQRRIRGAPADGHAPHTQPRLPRDLASKARQTHLTGLRVPKGHSVPKVHRCSRCTGAQSARCTPSTLSTSRTRNTRDKMRRMKTAPWLVTLLGFAWVIGSRTAAQTPASSPPTPGFHHLHLNSVNPD